jgi:predicted ATP-dependent endonuclease of OLD family
MIDHIFIKNYKAFKRKNIPINKNTLFIGTNASGKTTILEALDLFFNDVFHHEYVIDLDNDVIIEIHSNDERYRKVFKSPDFHLCYEDGIGDMFDINHIKYLYIPSVIYAPKLLNDILSINLASKLSITEQTKIFKIFDYLDGIVGNDQFGLFKASTKYEININKELNFSKTEFATIVSNITYPHLIIGIDNFENNFDLDSLKRLTSYMYQTIINSKKKGVVSSFDYSVQALYKDDIKKEIETITSTIDVTYKKILLLVEGKYDVAWFEKTLEELGEFKNYRVIPCGGYGNIQYVKKQLEKEGFKTIVITDGDTEGYNALKRDVIELYADVNYINKRFNTHFTLMPQSKRVFFKKFNVKDGIVNKVLSTWARKNLNENSIFVQEVKAILKFEEAYHE